MSHTAVSPETSVSEALCAGHQAARVFIRNHTACVGCPLARFCTLRDVAGAYGLSLEALLDELRQVAPAEPSRFTGAEYESAE